MWVNELKILIDYNQLRKLINNNQLKKWINYRSLQMNQLSTVNYAKMIYIIKHELCQMFWDYTHSIWSSLRLPQKLTCLGRCLRGTDPSANWYIMKPGSKTTMQFGICLIDSIIKYCSHLSNHGIGLQGFSVSSWSSHGGGLHHGLGMTKVGAWMPRTVGVVLAH